MTNEQLKFGEKALISQLGRSFEKVWEEEVIPEDWIIVIWKMGDTSYCGKNRGFSVGIILRATVSKRLQMILHRRLDVRMECLYNRENQCGFRQNRSSIDQISY